VRLKEIMSKATERLIKALYFVTALFLGRLVGKPFILCFHRIKKPSEALLDKRVGVTRPENFVKVIRFVKRLGYEFVALDDVKEMIDTGRVKKSVAITFDDGFKDLYQNAFPVLRQNRLPFTLFLTTALVDSKNLLWLHKLYVSLDRLPAEEREKILRKYDDKSAKFGELAEVVGRIIHSVEKRTLKDLVDIVSTAGGMSKKEEKELAAGLYLSREEIIEMKQHGLRVEAHGHEHWPLTNLNEAETRHEIETSIKFLKEKLNASPGFYALASGTSNGFLRNAAESLGTKGAVTIERKMIGGREDLFSLPRICVFDDMRDFYRVISVNAVKFVFGRG
jgi:peptidoglycan/xylan/chitin deacetylase (PgdA/CDA1 family)